MQEIWGLLIVYNALVRLAVAAAVALQVDPDEINAIFASRRGTWLSPQNVRRQWRQARAETGLEWVTPHTFRKTVATLIDKEADADSAAAQLGHKTKEMTKKHYIVKPVLAPDSSSILEQLGSKLETTDPGLPDHGLGCRAFSGHCVGVTVTPLTCSPCVR